MLEKNIYSELKDLFLKELNAGNVPEDAVAYIEDTKEIWTHGTYFGGKSVKSVKHQELLKMVASNSLKTECYYDIMDYEVLEQPYGVNYNIIPDNTIKTIIRVKAIDSSTLDPNAYYIATDNTSKEKIVKVFKAKYSLLPDSTELPFPYVSTQHGVVYWLQDDLGNEAPFDFYHIRFVMNDPEMVLTPEEFGIPEEGMTNNPNGWLIDSVMPFGNSFRNFTTNNILEYYNKPNNSNIGIAVTANPFNYGINPENFNTLNQVAFKNNTIKINLNAESLIIYAQLNFNTMGTYNNTITFEGYNIMGIYNDTLLISGYNNNIVNTRGYLSANNTTLLNSTYIQRNVHDTSYYEPDRATVLSDSYINRTIFHGTPGQYNNNIIVRGSTLVDCTLDSDRDSEDPTISIKIIFDNVDFNLVRFEGSLHKLANMYNNVSGQNIYMASEYFNVNSDGYLENGVLSWTNNEVIFIPNEKIYGIGSFENPHQVRYEQLINIIKNNNLIPDDYYRVIDFVASGSKTIPFIDESSNMNYKKIQNISCHYDIILKAKYANQIYEEAYISRPKHNLNEFYSNNLWQVEAPTSFGSLQLDQFKIKINTDFSLTPAYILYDNEVLFSIDKGDPNRIHFVNDLPWNGMPETIVYFDLANQTFHNWLSNAQLNIPNSNIIYHQFDITYMKDDHDNEYNFDAISTRFLTDMGPVSVLYDLNNPYFVNNTNCYRNKFESFSSFALIDDTEIKDNIISNSLVIGMDGRYKINNCTISNITTRDIEQFKLPYINLKLSGLDFHNDNILKLNNTHIDLINYDEFDYTNVTNGNFIITNAASTGTFEEWPDKITNATITYDCKTHKWISDVFKSEYNIIDIQIDNGAPRLTALIDNPMNIYEGQKILFKLPQIRPELLMIGSPYACEKTYEFISLELHPSSLPKYINNHSMPAPDAPYALIPIVCEWENIQPIIPPINGVSDRGYFQNIVSGEIIETVFTRIVDNDSLSYAFVILSPHSSSTRSLIHNMCSEMIQNEIGNINTILESIINE